MKTQIERDNFSLRCAAFRALRESAQMNPGPERDALYRSAVDILEALNPPVISKLAPPEQQPTSELEEIHGMPNLRHIAIG